MKYARIQDGKVVECPIDLPDSASPSDFYPADIAGQFTACPDSTEQGDTYANGKFAKPKPQKLIDPSAADRIAASMTPTLLFEALADIAAGKTETESVSKIKLLVEDYRKDLARPPV